MSSNRDLVFGWVEDGHLPPAQLDSALRKADIYPNGTQWRAFFDRLFLWGGATLLGAAVIYFFAYNWDALGRYAKFALVEVPLGAAIWAAWHWGPDRVQGKAAMLLASLLTGALLALVGQTYQTGADTFELFAVWTLAITPWVLLARMPALWLLWLLLANTALFLYWATFRLLVWWPFSPEAMLWSVFALNTAVLAVWEAAALKFPWLDERWAIRVVATVSGAAVTVLALWAIFEMRKSGPGGIFAWCAWMVAAILVYRSRLFDLYVLAIAVFSTVVVATSWLAEWMLKRDNWGAFLFIGLVIIGLSAFGAWWLRNETRRHALETADGERSAA
jgi:uncharacterized membrane protein